MALTIVPNKFLRGIGDKDIVQATVTFDSSYPTGGELIGAAELATLQTEDIDAIIPLGSTVGNTTSLNVEWVRATNALRLKTHATGTEVSNASNQSAVSVEVLVIGGGVSDA